MHYISVLENIKIYIKTCIKISPTCFGLRLSSGSLHMSLAEVTFIKSVKVGRYGLCGCVAACCHTTALHYDFSSELSKRLSINH